MISISIEQAQHGASVQSMISISIEQAQHEIAVLCLVYRLSRPNMEQSMFNISIEQAKKIKSSC